MDAPRRAWVGLHAIPILELSDAELSTAATACLAMAYQEGGGGEGDAQPGHAPPNSEHGAALCAARGETRHCAQFQHRRGQHCFQHSARRDGITCRYETILR